MRWIAAAGLAAVLRAHALARAGYPTLAIDRPGYGASDHPNGYTLTMEAYASIVGQIEKSLRAGSYGGPAYRHVGLMDHSAGDIWDLTDGPQAQRKIGVTGASPAGCRRRRTG